MANRVARHRKRGIRIVGTRQRDSLLLGVVRADITEDYDNNSLFLYRAAADGRWGNGERVMRGGTAGVHHPTMTGWARHCTCCGRVVQKSVA